MTLPVREGRAPFRGWETWYRVTGDLDSPKTPLLVLHGGPGCTHDYLLRFADLAETGRAVIHYDQIGNGRSTHLPDHGADFWTPALFVDELDNLIRHLGIGERYSVLGQSWGGMLAAEHAVLQPAGLRSLVIANSPASMRQWVEEANRLRRSLPPDVQAELLHHETAELTHLDAYQTAVRVFYDRHLCRVPWPAELTATFDALAADPTVYHTMNGPSEFHVIGTIKDWTIVDRLHLIRAPTLLISGRHDEATPAIVQVYADRIVGARWIIFEESSHLPHIEEPERCLATVAEFLDAHE